MYSGIIMQRGYGVGGLFRRLASGVLPLSPILAKAVASTALGVVSDRMIDVPFSKALKKYCFEAGKNGNLTGNLRKEKETVKRCTRPVNKRIHNSDVFGSI